MKKLLLLLSVTVMLMGCVMMDKPETENQQDIYLEPGKDNVTIDPINAVDTPLPVTGDPNKPVSNEPQTSHTGKVDYGNSGGSTPTSGVANPHPGIVATYEKVPFKAMIYRTNGYHEDVKYPMVTAIESKQQFDDYISKEDKRYDFSRVDLSMYDESFFKENTLVLIVQEEPSGSITHEVKDVYINDGVMTFQIHRNIPEIGTTDMAEYHIGIAIPKKYMITSRFVVEFTK